MLIAVKGSRFKVSPRTNLSPRNRDIVLWSDAPESVGVGRKSEDQTENLLVTRV